MSPEEIQARLNLSKPLLNVYPYGSRVYGTNTENSDHDFILVADSTGDTESITSDGVDATIYSVKAFEEALMKHEISTLECLWLPTVDSSHFLSKFKLDLSVLRRAIATKASNSYVKAKKKFTVAKDLDPYIAKKSLFHALRILKFGIQIAKHGKIVDYSEANGYWYKIMNNTSERWEDFKTEWQPVYNQLSSEFRLVAPKGAESDE